MVSEEHKGERFTRKSEETILVFKPFLEMEKPMK